MRIVRRCTAKTKNGRTRTFAAHPPLTVVGAACAQEGVFTQHGGCFAVDTGIFTGRSPKDKWIVKNVGSESDENLWWGSVNQPMQPEVFDELYAKAIAHFNTLDECYVFDGFCGANPASQKRIRFVHEMAWQQHFVTNMFIRPSSAAQIGPDNFDPDFTVINASSQSNERWQEHGLNSEVAVAINVEKKVAVIFGTWYGGENKKGIFSLMNYWLPLEGIMPMHCSANVGKGGDTALFFGLSGTGKTTLSADPARDLIGDDEHGWDNDGIFNFEGGCYAKTINLSRENEPDIWRGRPCCAPRCAPLLRTPSCAPSAPSTCTHPLRAHAPSRRRDAIKRDAMLENVYLDEDGAPDYDNVSKTPNGRVSYPIHHIANHVPSSMAGHPRNIIFLT
jgi:ATP-dependent phosphoenolpyruvate carboxykinase